MYYGKFGLANHSKAGRKKYGTKKLTYGTYDIHNRKLSDMARAQWHSLWHMYQSMWRMVSGPIIGKPEASVSRFEIPRRVEAVYFDQLIPNYTADTAVWTKYHDKIEQYVKLDWQRLEQTSRNASVRLVIAVRPNHTLTSELVEFLVKMWGWLGWPKKQKGCSTIKRFYVFTSCIPGKTVKEKAQFLSRFKDTFFSKVCLVADDISFKGTLALCEKFSMRMSFDFSCIRDADNKRVTVKSKEWKRLENTWRENEGSSAMTPVVFTSDNPKTVDMNKLLRHYSKKADIVLL